MFCQNFKPSRYCAERFPRFPKFYQELILFWENACIEQPKNFQDIINQSIWNNKFILREGDSIFYSSLHGKGLLFIRDLQDETGSFLNWSIVKEKVHVKIIFLPVIALSFSLYCPKLEQTLHKHQEQHS